MRESAFQAANGAEYDVAGFGAGISGARLFHELSAAGYRVLLLDHGDFASGTSQASGMMIWGGLLYLRNFDFRTVLKLSQARDGLIGRFPGKVRVRGSCYFPENDGVWNRWFIKTGLMLYWLLGSKDRRFPKSEAEFAESAFLDGRFKHALTFEEAVLNASDCRFVLEWILSSINGRTLALNHCETGHAAFDAARGCWKLELRDRLQGHEALVSAKFVVNAAGIWTDDLNARLGITSPYRHELSKGVYISIPRPASLERILVFDTGEHSDTFTMKPWGPLAMCGPTETRIAEISQGLQATAEDVRSLLHLANANLRQGPAAADIVSLRCGVRPLAVRSGFSKKVHPLELSRKHLIHHDRGRNAVAVYGGKLTSCGVMAEQVARSIAPYLPSVCPVPPANLPEPSVEIFPGMKETVPAADWCRDHEQCHTLEDYLRRRTNIAQWIPRGGLGRDSENLERLREIAHVFHPDSADDALAAYETLVRERHDQPLAAV